VRELGEEISGRFCSGRAVCRTFTCIYGLVVGEKGSHSEVKGVVAASMLGNQVGARALEPVKRAPHLSFISDLGVRTRLCNSVKRAQCSRLQVVPAVSRILDPEGIRATVNTL
jgi:hypothetical protein